MAILEIQKYVGVSQIEQGTKETQTNQISQNWDEIARIKSLIINFHQGCVFPDSNHMSIKQTQFKLKIIKAMFQALCGYYSYVLLSDKTKGIKN